ncbi:MAG TPA: LppX_LprAFG lipoprotein [Candidatus Limnocylindrales bacterium]
MPRRSRVVLALLALTVAWTVGACGSAAAPKLTDPKEILTKSIQALKDVKTVHLKADVSGQVKFDPSMLTGGSGGSAGASGGSGQSSIDLKGTSLEGDIDITGSKAHLAAAVPAFLGLSADLILIGDTTYMKLSLLGPKYQKSTGTSAVPVPLPSASMTEQQALDELTKALDKLSTPPKLVGVEQVSGKDAYHVQLTLSQQDLGGALPSEVAAVGSATLDVWTYVDGNRPAKIELKGGDANTGTLDVVVTMTDYDKAVTIQAPPDSEVESSPAAG